MKRFSALAGTGLVITAFAFAFWSMQKEEEKEPPQQQMSKVNRLPDPTHTKTPPQRKETNAAQANNQAQELSRDTKTVSQPDEHSDTRLAQLNPDYPSIDMRLHEMHSRRDGTSYDANEIKQAVLEPTAWQSSNAPGEGLDLTAEEQQDGREFITFNRLKLETLVTGDTLEIPIAQTGQTYQAKITASTSNDDGSVTWHGQLHDALGPISNDSGHSYDVTFTSGNTMVSGGIFTPEGHFVLESADEQGWISNASTLFKFDENEPDFIIPGDNDQH